MGFGSSDPEAQFKIQEQEMYDLATRCMAERGFDYTPPPISDGGDSAVLAAEVDSREWAETWGFGVSTMAFPESVLEPPAIGFDEVGAAENDVTDFDTSGLSPEEARAFEAAIDGPNGCLELAYQDAFPTEPDAFELEFGDDLAELYARVDSHPDLVAFDEDVLSCIEQEGISVDSSLNRELDDILGEVRAIEGLIWSSDAEGMQTLVELQEREVRLALAVHDCGGSRPEREKIRSRIASELESEFIEANSERLEDYRRE